MIVITLAQNVSAQTVSPIADPPLWFGKRWGEGLYEFNDAILATGAHRLHAIGITGQGVSAAVLDTLFDIDHPAIAGNIVHSASANFSNGYAGYTPDVPNGGTVGVLNIGSEFVKVEPNYVNVNWKIGIIEGIPAHGTHVAGIISSMAPDVGLVLLNSSAANYDVLGAYGLVFIQDFSDTDVLLDYAAGIANDYNIVSLNGSYGITRPFDDSEAADAYLPEDAAAIEKLKNAGVVSVFSSGNAAWNNYIGIPAGMSDAAAIGSMSPYGLISSFSNQNDMAFLLAPGQSVNSAVPLSDFETIEHGYAAYSGTSMAAPHVTGAIALLSSGARMASSEEILQSLYDSADRIIYDGNAIVKKKFMPGTPDPITVRDSWLLVMDQDADLSKYADWLTALVEKYDNDEVTADEWRTLNRIRSAAYRNIMIDFDGKASKFVEQMESAGDFAPLQFTEYGFLRVDKAYRDLTHKRMNLIADGVAPGLSGILYSYAKELYADINQDTADIFQRLDAQDRATQTVVARQMSPLFTHSMTESAHLGFVRMHRSLGQRAELNRLGCSTVNPCDRVEPLKKFNTTTWIEGFGGGFNKTGTLTNASYDGHFAGTAFGYEQRRSKRTFGLFGGWNHHRVNGDGFAQGDWMTLGGYGRIDHCLRFVEGSLSYGYGNYELTRHVAIPGAIFSNVGDLPDIVLDPMYKSAKASTHAHDFSMRVGAGRNLWRINGWTVGSRSEMSLSHLAFSSYRESGADSLNLVVNSYNTTYLEGGLGLFMGKQCRNLAVIGKILGMYGGMMGDDLSGSFMNNGSAYRIEADHISAAWVASEATLAWSVRNGIVISGSYSGRFGERYCENTGSVAVSLCW